MVRALRRSRIAQDLCSLGALLLATSLTTSTEVRAQDDVLTLRGAASQIGATFRDVPGTGRAGRDAGAIVAAVQPKSPAATAGLRAGDLVTALDGLSVRNARGLYRLVGETPPGRTVDVAVARDGRVLVLKVTPTLGRSIEP
jgi:S1-C subfamily serine protease